jgi:hypothetical protein
MIIAKDVVAAVVAEASKKMTDPNYSAVLVGGFVQTQKNAAHYISAHAAEVGGPEGVATTVFHAALLGLCFQKGYGRSVRAMTFADLDNVAEGDREERLGKLQPHVLEYIRLNVEAPNMRRVLVLIALAMEWVS